MKRCIYSKGKLGLTDFEYQTPDRKALLDLAREAESAAKNGNPISYDSAKILDEWANESLLFVKEFACKRGFDKTLKSRFKTNDSSMFRIHKDDENLWQMVYQILGAYFENDYVDELTNDSVLTAVLGK